MAKNSVSDWDVDAEQNEDIGGVDIRQTAPGSNIGPGIREVMAQIKEFILAASFPGVVTATSFYVSSATPAIRLIDTDAGTNEKIFRVISADGDVFLQSLTDASTTGANALILRRGTGTAWETVDFSVPALLNTTAMGLAFIGDTDTGIGQLVANTVSIFAANDAVPRVTVSATAVDIARPTNITGNTAITGNATVSGTATIGGNTTINGTLTVTG